MEIIILVIVIICIMKSSRKRRTAKDINRCMSDLQRDINEYYRFKEEEEMMEKEWRENLEEVCNTIK